MQFIRFFLFSFLAVDVISGWCLWIYYWRFVGCWIWGWREFCVNALATNKFNTQPAIYKTRDRRMMPRESTELLSGGNKMKFIVLSIWWTRRHNRCSEGFIGCFWTANKSVWLHEKFHVVSKRDSKLYIVCGVVINMVQEVEEIIISGTENQM